MRSARSIRPPLAWRPSDSALARSYDTTAEAAMMAKGSIAMWALSVDARYQATPPRRSASVTRSITESKNAPRWLAWFEALASAPSSRSGSAASTTSSSPARRAPIPMAMAAATPRSSPRMVRWSGLRPVRRSPSPSGLTARSTGARNLPSNTGTRLSDSLPRIAAAPGTIPRTTDQPAGAGAPTGPAPAQMGVLDGEDVSDREHPQRGPRRAQREREDDAGRGAAGTVRRDARASVASRTARPSRTPNRRRSSAGSPSRSPSRRSSGTATRST